MKKNCTTIKNKCDPITHPNPKFTGQDLDCEICRSTILELGLGYTSSWPNPTLSQIILSKLYFFKNVSDKLIIRFLYFN